jgi:hypothetical protein
MRDSPAGGPRISAARSAATPRSRNDAEVLLAIVSAAADDARPDGHGLLAARIRHFEGETVDSQVAWIERFAKLGRWPAWVGFGWP